MGGGVGWGGGGLGAGGGDGDGEAFLGGWEGLRGGFLVDDVEN